VFALSNPRSGRSLPPSILQAPSASGITCSSSSLYHTGLRVGECSGLVVHLVALDGVPRQYLHLPATICKGSRGRVVPLNAVAQACVRKLLAFNSARGFSTAPAAPLFQNRCHGPLSVRSMQLLVAHYREKAGLDVRATPHTYRHSFASHLVAAGVPTVHVQKALGHRQHIPPRNSSSPPPRSSSRAFLRGIPGLERKQTNITSR
jgi:integrase